ncbi:transposase [Micromonospora sp. NBC_00362]|uniref:transposase n=1 Tax=Micromonospora sp. NBC_00362 TaxID=2975975 RepID=UPI00225794FF|nr:transposase [Micromonospora sp. NBC_00362]MCX5121778.1 transposase [Micromonospora sp. NBC_00362]
MFDFDEFGPLTIRSHAGPRWQRKNHPEPTACEPPQTARRPTVPRLLLRRRRHHFRRYSPAEIRATKPPRRPLKSIRAKRPDGAPIYVILDNLSAHRGTAIWQGATRNKVALCFTPTYASWANPIEAHFGPLRTFVIAGSAHHNHVALSLHLRRYLRWRNANARPPEVLAAQRGERTRVHSE